MAYVLGYNLTHHSEQIINILFTYRGVTAKQLAALLNAPFQVDISREKSVYNYLRKFKKQGLVTAHKLQASVANGSLYYLTEKGFVCAKDILNIDEGQEGSGWLQTHQVYEKSTLADLPYHLYVPPLRQLAHHLMLVDFFIQVKMIDEDYGEIQYRNNLYSAHTYYLSEDKYRYRPDGELMIDGKRFAVEIDRSSEAHEKLLEKFETYKRYLDYCTKTGDSKIDGIIFIVESKRRDHGIKRRWTNVLAAYFKKLWEYRTQVNLIMTSLDMTRDTLSFELKRKIFEQKARNEVGEFIKKKGYITSTSWHDTYTKESLYVHGIDKASYQVFFHAISQEFESRIYTRYLDFLQNRLASAKSKDDVKGLEYEGHGKIIYYDRSKPFIVKNLSFYEIDNELIKQIDELKEGIHFQSFNGYLTFSLFE